MQRHPVTAVCAACVLALLSSHADAAAIEGRVRYEDGAPAPGVVVYALPGSDRLDVRNNNILAAEHLPRAMTDADGRFTLDGLNRSDLSFLARDIEDQCAFIDSVPMTGPIEFTIAPGTAIAVELFRGKTPVKGEKIHAALLTSNRNFRYVSAAMTNAAGRTRLSNVMPGQYVVQTIQEVPQVGCCFRSVVTKQALVTVSPGEEATVRFGGTDLPYITGIVRDTEGDPLHGTWVRLLAQRNATGEGAAYGPGASAPAPVVWSDVTTKDGAYALYDVPPGEYTMVCFRRLALNNYARTFETRQPVSIRSPAAGQTVENSIDVVVSLDPFMPLAYDAPAPALDANLASGEPFSLSDHRGAFVVIHFYAGWCKPCVSSMGDFDELADRFANEGVVVLGVSLDETEADFRAFVAEKGVTHPVIFDGPWADSALRKAFRVVTIPASFVVDPDGNVAQTDLFGDVLARFVEKGLAIKR